MEKVDRLAMTGIYLCNIVAVAVLGLVGVTSLLGLFIFGPGLQIPRDLIVQKPLLGFLVLGMPMILCLVLFPLGWEHWVAKTSLSDLGLAVNRHAARWVICFGLLAGIVSAGAITRGGAPLLAVLHYLLVGLAEDSLFRSVVQNRLEKIWPGWVAVVVSSVAFVVVLHNEALLTNLLTRLPISLALGYVFRSSKSLWASALLHGAYDILVVWH